MGHSRRRTYLRSKKSRTHRDLALEWRPNYYPAQSTHLPNCTQFYWSIEWELFLVRIFVGKWENILILFESNAIVFSILFAIHIRSISILVINTIMQIAQIRACWAHGHWNADTDLFWNIKITWLIAFDRKSEQYYVTLFSIRPKINSRMVLYKSYKRRGWRSDCYSTHVALGGSDSLHCRGCQ